MIHVERPRRGGHAGPQFEQVSFDRIQSAGQFLDLLTPQLPRLRHFAFSRLSLPLRTVSSPCDGYNGVTRTCSFLQNFTQPLSVITTPEPSGHNDRKGSGPQ